MNATPRAVPADPSALLATHETHQDESSEPALQSTLPSFGIMGRVMRYIVGFKEKKTFGDYAELTVRCLKETPKEEKKNSGCMVGDQVEGNRGIRGKKKVHLNLRRG